MLWAKSEAGSNDSTFASRANDSAALQRSYSQCRWVAKRAARNFYYSFLVLPRPQRMAMCALYTFMRYTDDLGDCERPVEERRLALRQWRDRLERVLSGGPAPEPWWLALADTVHRHGIAPELLHAVIDGVASDLDRHRYETFTELYHYCYQVASAVGLSCIRVWGVDDQRAALPAEWCGIAFQLTNVLRDVADDYRHGRIYLPAEDRRRFGVADEELGRRRATPQFEAMMHFQIARARDYYDRSRQLEQYLTPAPRAMFRVMTNVYGALLRKIARRPADVLRKRISLSTAYKLTLVAGAVPTRLFGRTSVPDNRDAKR
jgi:phytoene synthase